MDNTPLTRQEKKGDKKKADKSVYSAKRVRQMEALAEKRARESSTSRTPPKK